MIADRHPWLPGFTDDVFDRWREHADTPNAIFNPYFDREWRHHTDGPRTLVSQCRLIYNFARGFERYGDEAWANLTRRGIDALITCFHASGGGGWRWSCDGDGNPIDDTFDAYGHAFVILALATSATALGEPGYGELARATWEGMIRRFRDGHGGLIWHVDTGGRVLDDVRSQNPMMHSYEALLALAPLDSSGIALDGASAIWSFLTSRMEPPGSLPEWYEPDWQRVSTGDRAIVEVGHVFEWAFLLSEAADLFPEHNLVAQGRVMLDYGMAHGYDRIAGGIVAQIDYAGRVVQTRKGWWEQCEAIRALARYVTRHGAADYARALDQSLEFVRRHFVDDIHGGWFANPPGLGDEPSLDKGHVYKMDYHVINMCRELLAE